jgi:hypothetical protein
MKQKNKKQKKTKTKNKTVTHPRRPMRSRAKPPRSAPAMAPMLASDPKSELCASVNPSPTRQAGEYARTTTYTYTWDHSAPPTVDAGAVHVPRVFEVVADGRGEADDVPTRGVNNAAVLGLASNKGAVACHKNSDTQAPRACNRDTDASTTRACNRDRRKHNAGL